MRKKGRTLFVLCCVLVFAVSIAAGALSKVLARPSWTKEYTASWSDALGTLHEDLPYGTGDANRFDLYLPADQTKPSYGLAVYLHAGGFTAGDKKDDRDTLAWLCSKGYVACGINYTLRTKTNDASVLSQSNEIKAAIPKVVAAAREYGYPVDRMCIAGGSAGHCLAMIYAYRDGREAPVPVVLTYGGVGPGSMHQEDWGAFGLDKSDEACAAMFSMMAGTAISPDEIRDGSYLEKVKPISAADLVENNPVPTVMGYGAHDKMQPFQASVTLKKALEDAHADFRYFVFPHSGHGLQNDNKVSREWMRTIDQYLGKYMPVQ